MGQIVNFKNAQGNNGPMNNGPKNNAAESAESKGEWSNLLYKIAQQDDRDAFIALFNHFAPLLKTYAMSTQPALNSAKAEDFVQETMLKVWRKAHLFNRHKSNASTWIYAIGRNTRIDMLRTAQSIETVAEAEDVWHEAVDPKGSQDELLGKAREQAKISRAIEALPLEQTQIIRMIYIEGKSHQQIANETNIALGTVKSRVRLALKKLSHQFQE